MEFQMLQDRRHAGDFEVARDAWGADYNEASTFLGLLKSDSSENDSHYNNPDVDKLLEEAATSKDPSANYTKIEEQIAKDVPIIPIYFYTKNFMLKTNVKGWPYDNAEQVWYAKDLYKVAQ
jgi:oligopeptide transport system substrate-binding protein